MVQPPVRDIIYLFAQTAPSGTGNIISTLLMFGAMFAILYFILIRPQQKQQKKHQLLISSLKKGDEVILSSGIIGKIFSVEDRIIQIEIADKTRLKVLKQAVQALMPTEESIISPNQSPKA